MLVRAKDNGKWFFFLGHHCGGCGHSAKFSPYNSKGGSHSKGKYGGKGSKGKGGFKGSCYNCGQYGRPARCCPNGKGEVTGETVRERGPVERTTHGMCGSRQVDS